MAFKCHTCQLNQLIYCQGQACEEHTKCAFKSLNSWKFSSLEVRRRQPHEEPVFAEQQLTFVLVRGGSSSELGGLSSAWVIWSQSSPICTHREPWAGLTKAELHKRAAKCQISEQLCLSQRNIIFSLYLNMPYIL